MLRNDPGLELQRHPASAAPDSGLTNSAGQPPRFNPHDFRHILHHRRRLHGMPPHIAAARRRQDEPGHFGDDGLGELDRQHCPSPNALSS
jgi:hypothetical protein